MAVTAFVGRIDTDVSHSSLLVEFCVVADARGTPCGFHTGLKTLRTSAENAAGRAF